MVFMLIAPLYALGQGADPAPQPTAKPGASLYAPAAKTGKPRLFTVGSRGTTRLQNAMALSNGDFLLVGATDDISWTAGAPGTSLSLPPGASLPGGNGTTTPFVLHVSEDFENVKRIYTLPSGSLAEVTRIRSTEIPGQPTGALVISGRFAGLGGPKDAYWIARLNGNGVDKPISGIAWLQVVKAPGDAANEKKPEQPGDYAMRQPWDVRNDGQVIYAEGEPFATTWAALRVLSADGKPGVMPAWINEGTGPMLPLKAGRKGSLRSKTPEEFEVRQADENGNPGRKGRYPDDYYFSAHDSDKGPGYTGYRLGQNHTQRVSSLAIDRRDNALLFGTSTQTRLPGGLSVFESEIIAMNADGSLPSRARGDAETQDGNNSPPDQYVDCVSVDYAFDRLLVAARCHGNNTVNFWRGDVIARNPGRPGFKHSFTGRFSNIHISWLGRYALSDGAIHNATYVAEMAQGMPQGSLITEGLLEGWPSPNDWIDLTTTKVHELSTDPFGRAVLLGFGRRPYTTKGALLENVKPVEGVSRWTHFARVYSPDVAALNYSTILRGKWDQATGKSAGDEQQFGAPVPLADGFLITGAQTRGEGGFSPMPFTGAPAWGSTEPGAGAVSVGVVAVIPVPPPPPPPKPLDFTPEDAPKRRR